ncbi:uncharacterized protein LOC102806455 [Saccoglossus kowalevskii]|uniref:Uncharacterized protein LOC102806455 n=1 Tax=Saccoglossus kowalevskii TaxID=10224 RepID=A0ABM0MN75_SACKO|nr:PREDICTED: uncharacterized protein LOC102806455 [Saccoglossus kowalevskii]
MDFDNSTDTTIEIHMFGEDSTRLDFLGIIVLGVFIVGVLFCYWQRGHLDNIWRCNRYCVGTFRDDHGSGSICHEECMTRVCCCLHGDRQWDRELTNLESENNQSAGFDIPKIRITDTDGNSVFFDSDSVNTQIKTRRSTKYYQERQFYRARRFPEKLPEGQ